MDALEDSRRSFGRRLQRQTTKLFSQRLRRTNSSHSSATSSPVNAQSLKGRRRSPGALITTAKGAGQDKEGGGGSRREAQHSPVGDARGDNKPSSTVVDNDAQAAERPALASSSESEDEVSENDEEEENQELQQESKHALPNGEDGVRSSSKKNAIQLLDVASLSMEGSQGHANEDRVLVASNDRFHLFAVMDGHGGSWAGDFLVDKLLGALEDVYDDGFDHARLTKAMEELDRVFCAQAKRKMDTSGACLLAVLLYVDPNTNTPQKLVLNIGDCRAIMREIPEPNPSSNEPKDKPIVAANTKRATVGLTVALSDDHCAANVNEKRRVVRSGAYIQHGRIAGVLEPFRTIGDIDMKGRDMKNWVIATPEIRQSELLVGRSVLVIATDGVWCVLNNQRTMALAMRELGIHGGKPSAESAVHAIIHEARVFGSCDDISVVVVSV